MSGGSLNYLYFQVEEAAVKIAAHYGHDASYVAKGVAFAKLLFQVSKALKDVEWDMSGDGSDWAEVGKLISPREEASAVAAHLESLITLAQRALKDLKEV